MTIKFKQLSARVFLIALALLIVGSSVITTVMLMQSNTQREYITPLIKDCRTIIEAAQKWRASRINNSNSADQGYRGLRFDLLGFADQIGPNGLSIINPNGRFTLKIAEDGSTFTLIAEEYQGGHVIFRDIGLDNAPKPEIR